MLLAAGMALALTTGGAARAAAGLAALAAVQPVMACADVSKLDLGKAADTAVTISSATVVSTGPTPYCEVRGTIAPANTIVLRLPTQGWTQRYLQTGCGGLCGNANINYGKGADCEPVKGGSIASATTDMGHQGKPDGSWAAANPQAQIDFAYRGVHATAQVAKAIIARFYGKKPAYSYFNGCSDGGREALMEAQRYPDDFDGIAAGAPASNMVVQNTFHHAWNVLANKDAGGNYIVLAAKLPLLHRAVLDTCDRLDGVVDGVLEDPRRCDFDPGTLSCKAGQDSSTCLSAAEAEVVRKLHDGARDSQGRFLEQKGSHPWGSELAWTLFVPATQGATVGSENFVTSFARYVAYANVANPDWQLRDLEFNVPSFWKTVASSSYLSSTDPDLRRFARRGKLLLWHGWSDQHISAQGTISYYEALRARMGARAVDGFTRLYLFPGVTHCGGGEGPDKFDVLTPVMAWVEGGIAPGTIVAARQADNVTTRTRPVFPYPAVARWNGTGSSDDAANFVAVTTRHQEDDANDDWVGKPLYSHGYQASCKAVGSQLACTPSKLPFGSRP